MRIKLTEEHKRKIGLSLKGRKFSQERRNKMSDLRKGKHYSRNTEFKKGQISPNKGKKNISMLGDNHPNWKGDKVGYYALHKWLKYNFDKPDHCENIDCVYPRVNANNKILYAPKRFEWANLNGEYNRDKNNYAQLCPSCHRKFDMKLIKLTLKK